MFPTGGKKNTIQHLVGAFPVRTLARFCGAMNVTYNPKHSHIKKPILLTKFAKRSYQHWETIAALLDRRKTK